MPARAPPPILHVRWLTLLTDVLTRTNYNNLSSIIVLCTNPLSRSFRTFSKWAMKRGERRRMEPEKGEETKEDEEEGGGGRVGGGEESKEEEEAGGGG